MAGYISYSFTIFVNEPEHSYLSKELGAVNIPFLLDGRKVYFRGTMTCDICNKEMLLLVVDNDILIFDKVIEDSETVTIGICNFNFTVNEYHICDSVRYEIIITIDEGII